MPTQSLLSNTERQIMELLWEEGKPLSRQDLLTKTEGRSWNPSSIHLILNSMISKGVICITDTEKRYARTYEAVISQEDYLAHQLTSALPKKSNRDLLISTVAALVHRGGIDEATIQELENMLEEQRRALQEEKDTQEQDSAEAK